MEKIFALLNQMETDGVIGPYAIGGAVGAIFWLEPFATKDLDVFVSLPTEAGSLLLSLGPIYSYLLGLGHQVRGQFINNRRLGGRICATNHSVGGGGSAAGREA